MNEQNKLISPYYLSLNQVYGKPIYRELRWMGGIGRYQLNCCNDYYSAPALAFAMDSFNTCLKELCNVQEEVSFLDLAQLIPKDTTAFIDDCHFNENGAQEVASHITKYLKHQSAVK